jgi:hypothetical protein
MPQEDLRFYIDWSEALSESQSLAIASDLAKLDAATAELQTEKALGGLELVVSTIVVAMLKRTGEKIVDALWDAIRALRKSTTVPTATITLRATWENGEIRLVLPLDNEAVIAEQLTHLAALAGTPRLPAP